MLDLYSLALVLRNIYITVSSKNRTYSGAPTKFKDAITDECCYRYLQACEHQTNVATMNCQHSAFDGTPDASQLNRLHTSEYGTCLLAISSNEMHIHFSNESQKSKH